VNVAEYEAYAKDNMPRIIHGYYASGANDMITLRENRAAFARLRLMPKILVDVTHVNTETTILGDRVASPILVAPSAMQRMAHDHGECATAKAAARMNTLMTLSSWSTIALEEVANSAPGGLRWFQLYVYKDRKVTMDLVKRAEKAGYKAFAVTVDTPQVRHLPTQPGPQAPPGRGTTTLTFGHLLDCCSSDPLFSSASARVLASSSSAHCLPSLAACSSRSVSSRHARSASLHFLGDAGWLAMSSRRSISRALSCSNALSAASAFARASLLAFSSASFK